MVVDSPKSTHIKLSYSDSNVATMADDADYQGRASNFSGASHSFFEEPRTSTESPMMMSPWNHVSHFPKTSFSQSGEGSTGDSNALIGSLVREEGHIYSLATRGDLLYTGSDSKNIRVWRNLNEFSGFKSASGLVKAIVISSGKIFTGHQDGKIRVWKVSSKNPETHKRSGSLPTLKDIFIASIKPSNYVEVKKNRSTLWIKHSDAISCLSLCDDHGLIYSGSWDRTFKVWRISDSKCLESVASHDDAVNSVVASSDALVFTGSADGTIKVWRREFQGKVTKHVFVQTLLKQECAVTALVLDPTSSFVYCGSSDGLVNFWEKDKDLAHGGELRGHKLAVLCLAARSQLVFSGSVDKNICVWRRDGAVHLCLSVLSGHTGPVKCLAVEEVDKGGEQRYTVYSGSLDKSIKVWSVGDQEISSSAMMLQQQVMEADPGSDQNS